MAKNVAGSTHGDNKPANREAWLTLALAMLREYLVQFLRIELPPRIRISLSSPGRKASSKRPGEVFTDRESEGNHFELFIRAHTSDPIELLTVLVSLLIIVLTEEGPGFGRRYKAQATTVNLLGTLNEPTPGLILGKALEKIAADLGDIPHNAITPETPVNARKKQGASMFAYTCATCGYTLRLTGHWAAKGIPLCSDEDCSNHGSKMQPQSPKAKKGANSSNPEEAQSDDEILARKEADVTELESDGVLRADEFATQDVTADPSAAFSAPMPSGESPPELPVEPPSAPDLDETRGREESMQPQTATRLARRPSQDGTHPASLL